RAIPQAVTLQGVRAATPKSKRHFRVADLPYRPSPRQRCRFEREVTMNPAFWLGAAIIGGALAATGPAPAEEAPKYGGTLTFMIPADAPRTCAAQREQTSATIHSAAPFYSTLIRINPLNPGSSTDIVCD